MKLIVWVRSEVLKVVYEIEKLGPPIPATAELGSRVVQFNLDFDEEQLRAIDSLRGGMQRGTWVRDVALRQAFNSKEKDNGEER